MSDYYDPFSLDGEGGDDAPVDTIAAPMVSAGASDGKIRLDMKDVTDIVDQTVKIFDDAPTKPWIDLEATGKPDLSLYEPTCSIDNWSHTAVDLKVSDGIAYVILNRPEENNLVNNDMNTAFLDATHLLHKREDIRVVVLTARGKMFCGGRDPTWDGVPTGLKVTPEVQAARDALCDRAMLSKRFKDKEDMPQVPHVKGMWNFCTLPQLTICIVNGSAMGFGIGFMSVCDVCIAVKNTFFTMSEVKMGLVPALLGPYICGKTRMSFAKLFMMQGLTKTVQDLAENGFIQWVVEDMAAAQEKLKEVVASIQEMSPTSICDTKRLGYAVSGRPVTNEVMWYTIKELNKCLGGEYQKCDEAPWKNSTIAVLDPPPWQ